MRVIVTAGPTREYIDTVRFLTNASSGKMGYACAAAAATAGHQVTLITGYGLVVPPDLHDVAVTETIRAYEAARAGENDAVGVGPLGTIIVSKAFTDKSRRILNRYSNRMGWFR